MAGNASTDGWTPDFVQKTLKRTGSKSFFGALYGYTDDKTKRALVAIKGGIDITGLVALVAGSRIGHEHNKVRR